MLWLQTQWQAQNIAGNKSLANGKLHKTRYSKVCLEYEGWTQNGAMWYWIKT